MRTIQNETGFIFNDFSFYFKTILCILLVYKSFSIYAQSTYSKTDTFSNNKLFISWAKNHAFPLQNSDSAIGNVEERSSASRYSALVWAMNNT